MACDPGAGHLGLSAGPKDPGAGAPAGRLRNAGAVGAPDRGYAKLGDIVDRGPDGLAPGATGARNPTAADRNPCRTTRARAGRGRARPRTGTHLHPATRAQRAAPTRPDPHPRIGLDLAVGERPGLDRRRRAGPRRPAAGGLCRPARAVHSRIPYRHGRPPGRGDAGRQRVDPAPEAVDRRRTPPAGRRRLGRRRGGHALRRRLLGPRALPPDPAGRGRDPGRRHFPGPAGPVVATWRAPGSSRRHRRGADAGLHGSAGLVAFGPDGLCRADRRDGLLDLGPAPMGQGGRRDADRAVAAEHRPPGRAPGHVGDDHPVAGGRRPLRRDAVATPLPLGRCVRSRRPRLPRPARDGPDPDQRGVVRPVVLRALHYGLSAIRRPAGGAAGGAGGVDGRARHGQAEPVRRSGGRGDPLPAAGHGADGAHADLPWSAALAVRLDRADPGGRAVGGAAAAGRGAHARPGHRRRRRRDPGQPDLADPARSAYRVRLGAGRAPGRRPVRGREPDRAKGRAGFERPGPGAVAGRRRRDGLPGGACRRRAAL